MVCSLHITISMDRLSKKGCSFLSRWSNRDYWFTGNFSFIFFMFFFFKNLSLSIISKTIDARNIKLGSKVVRDNTFKSICILSTSAQRQGHQMTLNFFLFFGKYQVPVRVICVSWSHIVELKRVDSSVMQLLPTFGFHCFVLLLKFQSLMGRVACHTTKLRMPVTVLTCLA